MEFRLASTSALPSSTPGRSHYYHYHYYYYYYYYYYDDDNWPHKHTHKIHTKMYSYAKKLITIDIHENTDTTAIKGVFKKRLE